MLKGAAVYLRLPAPNSMPAPPMKRYPLLRQRAQRVDADRRREVVVGVVAQHHAPAVPAGARDLVRMRPDHHERPAARAVGFVPAPDRLLARGTLHEECELSSRGVDRLGQVDEHPLEAAYAVDPRHALWSNRSLCALRTGGSG